jgi:hypothetical protein
LAYIVRFSILRAILEGFKTFFISKERKKEPKKERIEINKYIVI